MNRVAVFFFVGALFVGCGRVVDDGSNLAPVAIAGSDVVVAPGVAVTFDGSGSSDDDGIESFAWDFGDGASDVGSVVDHAYVDVGGFVATLTVRDAAGASASDTVVVRVEEEAVVARVVASATAINAGDSVHFDASTSTAPSAIASTSWRFGDGESGEGSEVDHVFASAGSFTVRVTVTDEDGGSDEESVVVVVAGADLAGTYDLEVPAFACASYSAVFPDTTLVITQVGDDVTALGANGRSYSGTASDNGVPLRGTVTIDAAGCGSAAVDIDWRAEVTSPNTLGGFATGFFDLAVGCQCTAAWDIVATRR